MLVRFLAPLAAGIVVSSCWLCRGLLALGMEHRLCVDMKYFVNVCTGSKGGGGGSGGGGLFFSFFIFYNTGKKSQRKTVFGIDIQAN